MSDNTQTLSPEDAYNVLVAQVHAPVFFEKLARVYKIEPKSPEEARELLLMAGQLRNAYEQENEKQAGAGAQFLSQARNDLNGLLGQYGYRPLPVDDGGVRKQASAAGQNPLVKEAALVFSNHLARIMQ